tara:strand:+ start:814 stop:972 length:159 start_codon:yes stop_codon:yes gene_type:complete
MLEVLQEIKEPQLVKKKKPQILEERLLNNIPYEDEADEQPQETEEKENGKEI